MCVLQGPYHAKLPQEYREKALKLIEMQYKEDGKALKTHVLRWCACDLIELPKRAKKTSRCFFGCPAWSPLSRKRKRVTEEGAAEGEHGEEVDPAEFKYCCDFAHISAKQREVLGL